MLVEVRFANPSADSPAAGGIVYLRSVSAATVRASGRPTFFRTYPAVGGAAVFQGTAGPEADDPADNPDLIVPGDLRAGDTFRLASFFYRADRGRGAD